MLGSGTLFSIPESQNNDKKHMLRFGQGPLLVIGERRTRLRDMVAESPACFVEADRLKELSARIDQSVSDPEAKKAYNAAISAYSTSQTPHFPQVIACVRVVI